MIGAYNVRRGKQQDSDFVSAWLCATWAAQAVWGSPLDPALEKMLTKTRRKKQAGDPPDYLRQCAEFDEAMIVAKLQAAARARELLKVEQEKRRG